MDKIGGKVPQIDSKSQAQKITHSRAPKNELKLRKISVDVDNLKGEPLTETNLEAYLLFELMNSASCNLHIFHMNTVCPSYMGPTFRSSRKNS